MTASLLRFVKRTRRLYRPIRGWRSFSSSASASYVQIGNIRLPRGPSQPLERPDLLARNYLPAKSSPSILSHLQWMMKKDSLKQDMCLIGPPGGQRRNLALAFAELLQRPVQVVTITADLTESDLKQRRELVTSSSSGGGNSLELSFVNAAPVDAALNGHILILDGLEKASRNTLPTLNNLLEHRSMNLEDGRFLISPDRYQQLQDTNANAHHLLVPVHPDFRVIATAVPAPPFPGRQALDPPLRSRFQIRRIDELWEEEDWFLSLPDNVASLAMAMEQVSRDNIGIWPLPKAAATTTAMALKDFPQQDVSSVLLRAYPVGTTDARVQDIWGNRYEACQSAFASAWKQVGGDNSATDGGLTYRVESVEHRGDGSNQAQVTIVTTPDNVTSSWLSSGDKSSSVSLDVPCGKGELQPLDDGQSHFCRTEGLESVLTAMMQSHAAGRDMLLLSPPGESKSATAGFWASMLGYQRSLVHGFSDMTSRDLFLRRITDPVTGETAWKASALLQAVEQGHFCILDNAEKLRPDVLGSLESLCNDRDVFLPDGRRILRADRAKDLPENDPNIVRVHPSFRLVLLASMVKETSWLSQEVMGMVDTIIIPAPSTECTRAIVSAASTTDDERIERLLELRSRLTAEVAADCGVSSLSTRNLIRIAKRSSVSLHDAVCEVLVADLLPPTQRAALESVLREAGIVNKSSIKQSKRQNDSIVFDSKKCTIGNFTMTRANAQRPEMVPSPKFFDIPSHVLAIKDLLMDWKTGERAFLLLGNQGVGKNMVIDRLCEVANFEREYIQLHRDSTIGQITLQPTLEDGRVVWHDSPLVKAVSRGLSLVVDEADKAPTEVLAVLKGLVEDGELLLGDGRRLSRHDEGPGIIQIHPDFTLWVLANRPGFPFLGNAFFTQIGDCFSTRVLANPDLESEINLLQSYGPSVDPKLLRSLAGSFAELRNLSDHGDIAYPYSTREAVAVVKHLEQFPDDGILSTLHNVLDFDSFQPNLYATLGQVFQRHGIPVEDYASWQQTILTHGRDLSVNFSGEGEEDTSSNPPPLSSPKFGKWDDKNEAHVGGNQWAGGTGGSNTAGLGGRGGPFRLDRGHRVHQVSDEAKAQVSVEAARAARAMAQEALKKRLSEINMSESEWDMYHRFVDPIQDDIANLRAILNQAELRQEEKGWLKRQSQGELDDTKLVDGVTGDKYIYKRRGIADNTGLSQKPKRLRFVVDISGSMYRFNGYDSRLIRCLEATNLIMESFHGMEDRFDYSIVGHSGDSTCIPLVEFGEPPENEKQRMKVLQTMIAHSQYCIAGDHTLEAMDQAITAVATNDGDDEPSSSLVVAISDANLERYGIHPRQLGKIMERPGAKSHCIFIASFGREAEEIKRELPVGRGHVCMQTSDLPRIVRNILAAQV